MKIIEPLKIVKRMSYEDLLIELTRVSNQLVKAHNEQFEPKREITTEELKEFLK